MRKYLYIALAIIIGFAGTSYMHQRKEAQKYRNLYYKELQNVEAYQASYSGLQEDLRQYQMTMDELKDSKDSLDRKLVEAIRNSKVKEKNIQHVQYQTKIVHKTDTLNISDTVFVKDVHVDTVLSDPWYSLNLKLDYPSTIVATPSFKSEQYVIVNTKKEYDNKPSRLFFIRWFQKKHIVTEVNIEEKSPYVINKENKFVKITK